MPDAVRARCGYPPLECGHTPTFGFFSVVYWSCTVFFTVIFRFFSVLDNFSQVCRTGSDPGAPFPMEATPGVCKPRAQSYTPQHPPYDLARAPWRPPKGSTPHAAKS